MLEKSQSGEVCNQSRRGDKQGQVVPRPVDWPARDPITFCTPSSRGFLRIRGLGLTNGPPSPAAVAESACEAQSNGHDRWYHTSFALVTDVYTAFGQSSGSSQRTHEWPDEKERLRCFVSSWAPK